MGGVNVQHFLHPQEGEYGSPYLVVSRHFHFPKAGLDPPDIGNGK